MELSGWSGGRPVTGFSVRDVRPAVLLKHFSPYSYILTEHHAMKAYWGIGDIAELILNLGTRWR
jgi:hypothetical protein